MPYTVIQAGTSLQFLDEEGNLSTLTLPTNVTLSSNTPPRWCVYGNFVVLVNTPSVPLTIDATGTVRPLTPKAPQTAPVVSAGDAGDLSGTYSGIKYTFLMRDANGAVIAESEMSPASNSVTITNQQLRATAIETSDEDISARRLYRPTTDGTTLFPWLDLDGNTITQVQDDLADAGLSLVSAPTLGNPPRLILLAEWRNRLWGVGDTAPDDLRYAQADAMYSWPEANSITLPGEGRDRFGIRALMPRREALGVARRDQIWQITGTTPSDFRAVKLSDVLGVESQETVASYRDTVYWLWKDGVYSWSAEGIKCISDSRVKSWFSTDDYFNRGMFPNAFALFDPKRLKYRLFLASADSTSIDRWVEYDIKSDTWWGPHQTGAFSPRSAFLLSDGDDKVEAVMGSSTGYVFKEQTEATDGTNTGIDFDVQTKFYDGQAPDVEKVWLDPSIHGKVQDAGEVTITPYVGYTDATAGTPLTWAMSAGRQVLDRLGIGKLVKLRIRHTKANEPVEIHGLELPHVIKGRR